MSCCSKNKTADVTQIGVAAPPEPSTSNEDHACHCGFVARDTTPIGACHTCPNQVADWVQRRLDICGRCDMAVNGVCMVQAGLYPKRDNRIDAGCRIPYAKCPLNKAGWHRVMIRCESCGRKLFDDAGPTICFYCSHLSPLNARSNGIGNPGEVAILTTHYNPKRFNRLRETYYEWFATLGPLSDLVTCYELVFGDAEPEIEGSIVLRGNTENLLWQKEAMLNIGLRNLPDSVRYVAWIDHDIVFHDPGWLSKAIGMIDEGAIAVQLFQKLYFLGAESEVAHIKTSKMENGIGSPGGAWIADRTFLDQLGGLYDRNISGGGDVAFYAAMTGHKLDYIQQHEGEFLKSFVEWLDNAAKVVNGRKATYLPITASHLYHGRRENRQYTSREKMIRKLEYNPFKHIEHQANGLIRWTDEAPSELREYVSKYFDNRKEDE